MQMKHSTAVCSRQNRAINGRVRELLYLFVLVISLASCQREQDWEGAPDIKAKVESEQKTRTSLSVDESGAGTIYWNPSDKIDVFFGTTKASYTSQNASDAITAVFKTSDSVSGVDITSSNIWGLYPSNGSSSCDGNAITTTLPATQYGVPNTFDKDIFPAVARSSSTDLQFYNVCGGIKFNLAYDDIKKITFRGNNNENLAGTVSISFVEGLPKATIVNGVKEITLTPKSGSTFTKEKDYYITLLPGTLSKGFTMTFTATDGTVGTLNYTDASVTIKRSIFSRKGSMDVYAAFGDGRQPNNVIYYTSSDGQVVTPNKTDVFGASIVSNEYVGGRGIITFDGEVTSIGEWAFNGCDNLRSIIIPNSVTSIGDGAFNNCTYLKRVVIPESVTSIGSYVFGGCYWMKTITILNPDPPTIMDDTFYFRTESEAPYGFFYYHIFVPEDSVSAYKNAQYWDQYPYWSGYGWRNSDQIYPIMPFIASDFYVPTYIQACYIDLDARDTYTINPFEFISIYHDDRDDWDFDGEYWNRREPIILNGVWLEGDGDNGIPSGLTAWEFYHFRIKNTAIDTSFLPAEIRSRVSYNGETNLFSFDYSSGEDVTGSYEIPITIDFNAMFWLAQPFIVNVVLRGKDVTQPHEAVDLGLSVKWATCNVGADNPEEYGDYFAWGETEAKTDYSWPTYEWCNGSYNTMTKYCNNSSYGYNGFTDNKTVLDPEDDAAHVNWGGSWRMPTDAEWTELRNNCTWTWTTQDGVNGYRVTSKKTGYTDKSIFIPAAGGRYDASLYEVGTDGNYWSSFLDMGNPFGAWYVTFRSGGVYRSYSDRSLGFSVRPVSE